MKGCGFLLTTVFRICPNDVFRLLLNTGHVSWYLQQWVLGVLLTTKSAYIQQWIPWIHYCLGWCPMKGCGVLLTTVFVYVRLGILGHSDSYVGMNFGAFSARAFF